MRKEKWINGAKVLKQDLEHAQDAPEQSIKDRQVDSFVPGVLPDLYNGMALELGAGTNSVTVRTGVAYTSVGERIYISNETIPYNSAKPSTTTSDGLGGNTPTPLSTGSANITMSSGAVNLIYAQYLLEVEPSEFTLHKVTGKKLFTDGEDGYELRVVNAGSVNPTTINLVSSAPGDGGPWTFLGWVDYRGGGSVSPSMLSTTSRPLASITTGRMTAVTPKADLSDKTPDGNYGPSTIVTLDQHVKAVGSTVPTASNPHGMTFQDLGFTGKSVETHETYLHASGIVNGVLDANAGDSLNLQINPRCPDVDDVVVYGLSADQFIIVNGTTLSKSDLFGVTGTKTFSFDTSSAGTYYFYVNTTTRTVEVGTTLPVLSAGKFLLWTVSFATSKAATNIVSGHFIVPPAGPCAATSNFTNLVDGRLFGNLGSDNLQTDGQTDTFTIEHSLHVEQNIVVDADIKASTAHVTNVTVGSGVIFPSGDKQTLAADVRHYATFITSSASFTDFTVTAGAFTPNLPGDVANVSVIEAYCVQSFMRANGAVGTVDAGFDQQPGSPFNSPATNPVKGVYLNVPINSKIQFLCYGQSNNTATPSATFLIVAITKHS